MVHVRHTRDTGPVVASDRAAVRAAWIVSLQSVVWTLLGGAGSIAIGVAKGSVLLAAFGCIGLVDAIGSAALVHHFRHGLRHEELPDDLERLAHRVVVTGLVAVGLGALTAGGVRLAGDHVTESSALGTSLAAASLVVMIVLSRRKRRLALEVASPALRSDGHLSAVGAAQASVALAGAVTTIIGWRWADPAAAMGVGVVAMAVGVQTWWAQLRSPRSWSRRAWVSLAVGFLVAVAVLDAVLGHRLIITGLLAFAPGLAAVSRRPTATMFVGATAVGLAVALGAPNEIWLTVEHVLWIAAVSIVAMSAAALILIASRHAARQSVQPAQ